MSSLNATSKSSSDQKIIHDAVKTLSSVMHENDEVHFSLGDTDLLNKACQKIFTVMGVVFYSGQTLEDIIARADFRTRKVNLAGDWWLDNHMPLLAFTKDNVPVALVPTKKDGYLIFNPKTGESKKVNKAISDNLSDRAVMFYQTFTDNKVSFKNIWRLTQKTEKKDWFAVIGLGLLLTLFLLVLPYGQKILVETILPHASFVQLRWLVVVLLSAAIASAGCYLTRGFILLRILGKSDYLFQSALWDRLLKLPATFFSQFRTGDLTMRMLGVQYMRYFISVATVSVLLSVPLSLLYIILIACFSPLIGVYVLFVLLLFLGVVAVLSKIMLKFMYKQQDSKGRVTDLVLQFLLGLAKIRTTGAESRFFGVWANRYADQQRNTYQVLKINAVIQTWAQVFPFITTLFLFSLIARAVEAQHGLSAGDALLIMATFGSLTGILLNLVFTLLATLAVVPLYQRLQPILETMPESKATQITGDIRLSGEINLRHIRFKYPDTTKYILNDLSLHIMPKEYVAIVGPSGAGKSTLLRILLGFEQSESGGVFFGNKSIDQLPIKAVRQNMGVVLQNAQLVIGSIYENITGTLSYTMDEAWAVAEQVGLADDIKALPMGMFTFLTDGADTLSSGQKQLILIARALIQKPKIIILDEATSLMDNVSQERVTSVLKSLDVTRIVIAHRLSTVKETDRVCVIDSGRVVESGGYQDLLNERGAFAEMVSSQLHTS